MPTALITGVTGQDGAYLSRLLLEKGYKVAGLVRRSSTCNFQRIVDPLKNDNFALAYGDLCDATSMRAALDRFKPDEVYNLGAMSHVRVSFDAPVYTAEATGTSSIALLEAIRQTGAKIRYYQASSSEMFGSTPPPQNENTPFHPRSPYGCAKVFSYWATVNYRESYGMHASNGILFNHESPLRGELFVTRKITRAVARIFLKKQDELFLGNLYAKRDWGFAGDYVEAMWLMLQQELPDDYVIATGKTYSVHDFVEKAFNTVGLDWRNHVKFDANLLRPAEVEVLLGDPSKAEKKLGWKPKVDFDALVKMMVYADIENER